MSDEKERAHYPPVAYLKEWASEGGAPRKRVDLKPDLDAWMPATTRVTPLYACPAPPEPTADLKAVEILEAEVPEIIERGARGEALTVSEQAAWTGYELGWRDGRAERPADLKAVREVLEPFAAVAATIPQVWKDTRRLEVVDATAEASDFTAGDFRRVAEVYAAINLDASRPVPPHGSGP